MRTLVALFLALSPLIASNFDLMMGQGCSRWSYIDSEHRVEQLNTFAKLFAEREPLLEQGSQEIRIPHTIHLIWLGPKCFPIKSIENILSWKKEHPGWKLIFWTDRIRPAPVSGMEVRYVEDFEFTRLKELYEQSENWCEKSDLLRYEILAQEGGLYIDHDAFCLANVDHLHANLNFYCGLEVPHYPIDGEVLTVGIGVLGSLPKHPIMLEVIDTLEARWDEVSRKYNASDALTGFERVMHRTYAPMTLTMYRHLNDWAERDMVFPAAHFYPQESMEGIYSEHKYGSSWNSYGETSHAKFAYQQLKKPIKYKQRVYRGALVYTLTLLSLGLLLCAIYFLPASVSASRAVTKKE